MIVACSGIARPIRNSPLTARRNRLLPRTIAKAAMKEISTAGTIGADGDDDAVEEVLRTKSFSMTSW